MAWEVDLKTSTDIDLIFDYLLARMQYHMDDDAMMAKVSIRRMVRQYTTMFSKDDFTVKR